MNQQTSNQTSLQSAPQQALQNNPLLSYRADGKEQRKENSTLYKEPKPGQSQRKLRTYELPLL